MKKIKLLGLFLALASAMNAQITYNTSYNQAFNFSLTKFHVSGYKYVKTDIQNLKIDIYNTNHTLFKTISIPAQTTPIQSVSFISENLFDTDNLMEYALVTTLTTPANYTTIPQTMGSTKYSFYIYKENGTQMMFRDSASIGAVSENIFANQSAVFFDGTQTKMRLNIQGPGQVPIPIKTEIYSLPGSIPCSECSSNGTVTGISTPNSPGTNNPVFYPNPVTNQLKLKYDLPKDYKKAEINVYDLQGKLLENLKVTNTFDFIYLPSDYNNGLYLYSLVVDDKIIKTEKIILNR